MAKWMAYLQLARPANVVTAVTDILAGASIAIAYLGTSVHEVGELALGLLLLSTCGLYGGGVVFNDVFDAQLDAKERPERPIPSGRVSIRGAILLGTVLFLVGMGAAAAHTPLSGAVALATILMCLMYDKWAKHHPIAGPLTMGLCRGLNLLLGMSFLPEAVSQTWMLAGIPVLYIAAVTTISRGEVHGGHRQPLLLSALGYAAVIGLIAYFGNATGIFGIALLAVFALFVYPPLVTAIRTGAAGDIRKSVKHGVLGLIFMNAAWAAVSGSWVMALVVLALFPVSIGLARLFSVT